MRDDRDNYDRQDDSEYHFSEEDVSYDVETEVPKTSKTNSAQLVLNRLTRSKRMLISIAVFFALIFIVYKMVSPSSSVPSTNIAPVVAQKTSSKPMENKPTSSIVQPTVAATVPAPVSIPAETIAPANNSVATQPMPPTMQPVMQSSAQPMPSTMQPQTAMTPPPAQPAPVAAPMMTPSTAAATPSGAVIPPTSVIDQGIAAMTATENNLTAQMQSTSAQKINEFEAQNKALRDQLDTLNARMSTMENQLNQLVQALMKQNQSQAVTPASPVETAQPAVPKIAYSVQAIIPGRAWLRSDSGETVTVAEGDVIKDAGRVTKIDPYDGVVEINVGGKLVSLSYGNGA